MIIKIIQLDKIMQTIERREIHASISYDATYNNTIKTMLAYDISKALSFEKCVKSNDVK